MPTRRLLVIAAALLALLSGVAGSTALAASDGSRAKASQRNGHGVALHVPQSVRSSLRLRGARLLSPRHRAAKLFAEPAPGEVRRWVGLDTVHGTLVPKLFSFRGAGSKIEVWVSNDLSFPAPDCRNGDRTQVTDGQVAALIGAFDGVIYPRESAVFSVPPSRDGTKAKVGPPAFNPQGAGDRVVVLVDNIRDEAYFDADNAHDFPSAIGIYSAAVDNLFDRNVMSIDAYDWVHRTGAHPPHEPAADRCADAPAWPFLVEGVFAHEYEHLLEEHEDADESSWLDEGLAEWARSLTGYADPARPTTEIGYDKHTQCFLGNLPALAGGAENSLTIWGDGGDVNCDYGAVYSFTEYLGSRFGTRLLTSLHRGDANGLAGLQEALGRRPLAQDVLHDWSASLSRQVNWENPRSYSSPGVRPNGSDFVRLRDASGRYLRAKDIESLSFDGATRIPGRPVEWSVDAAPPNGGPSALYSGGGNNLDRTIVRALSVPAGGAAVTFDAQWNLEEDPSGGWDFTFVQVSTDGGATYKSILCTSSRFDASPNARPVMRENLPGYTAYSAGWRSESCSLAAFAGRSILLGFRNLSDGSVPGDPDDPAATIEPGFWLRNLRLDGALVSDGSSLVGWLSPSQARPTAVHGFTVQLVGYSTQGRRATEAVSLHLDAQHDAELGRKDAKHLLGGNPDVVAAIVTYDEPTETISQSAPYTLRVNGVVQPG